MTLAAAVWISGLPVLISDSLVSRQGSVPTQLSLPSWGPVADLLSEEREITPTALCQKTELIGESIAVAWSGPVIHASRVMQVLEDNAASFRNVQEVEQILEGFRSEPEHKNSAFVGFFREPTGEIKQFTENGWSIPSERYGQVCLIGSGADYFRQLLEAESVFDEFRRSKQFVDVLSEALTLTGLLLTVEISTGWTVSSGYGGAYDVTTLLEDRWVMTGNPAKVAFVHWTCDWAKDDLRLRVVVVRGHYGKTARYQVLEFGPKGRIVREEDFLVEGARTFFRSGSPRPSLHESTIPFDFESVWMCNYFLLRSPKFDQDRIVTHVTYTPLQRPPLAFRRTGANTIRVDFLDPTWSKVSESLQRSAGY